MGLTGIEGKLFDFRQLELLAADANTAVHQLDPRAKLLVTAMFILTVASFNRFELAALLPFVLYPLVLTRQACLPAGPIFKKVVMVIPFVFVIGLGNLIFDRNPLHILGNATVPAGWFSFTSLLLRAVLTVSAAVLLVATTGFMAVCEALQRIGMPRMLVAQLFFMYRYLFVLAEDAVMTSRARELRSFGRKGMGWRPFSSMLAHLLLRSWERAERIHMAMLARGGSWRLHQRQQYQFGSAELFFVAGWGLFFLLFRCINVSLLLGVTLSHLVL